MVLARHPSGSLVQPLSNASPAKTRDRGTLDSRAPWTGGYLGLKGALNLGVPWCPAAWLIPAGPLMMCLNMGVACEALWMQRTPLHGPHGHMQQASLLWWKSLGGRGHCTVARAHPEPLNPVPHASDLCKGFSV